MQAQPRDGWPELTYRYVKHYYWEPQHLHRSIDETDQRLRRQEVPLNYLLNVLLRLLPASYRRAVLEPFGVDLDDPGLGALILRTPPERDYVQPDVYLESAASRVFIEVKVDAPLGLEQVRKYVRLHADLDATEDSFKKAYLLLLVKRDPLWLKDVNRRVRHVDVASALPALLNPGGVSVAFGAATWQAFADGITRELERRRDERPDAVEMLDVLTGDFLEEMYARKLADSAGGATV